MQSNTLTSICDALSQAPIGSTGFNLSDFSAVNIISPNESHDNDFETSTVAISVALGVPLEGGLLGDITSSLKEIAGNIGVNLADVQFKFVPPSTPDNPVKGVKQIIAVASGKGGVGKSTTATNLALALAGMGAKVGLMDADIYGPSQPMMLGLKPGVRPKVIDNKFFEPIEVQGIFLNSMGLLVDEKTPMVWRGPMATGALQQLLLQTKWPGLDYLVIDMPPGTGDIHLTLAQKATLAGAVVVTTPQDIACLDAKKGIEMFSKVEIPLLGLVENMAVHQCPKCGHESHIFGNSGAERIASQYGVPLLGKMPLNADIRLSMDKGLPIMLSEPECAESKLYRQMALNIALQLWLFTLKDIKQPEIEIV